jgi:acyl-CoA reductase-like NAD-dependent aldehyde dehydrogenase
VQWIKNRTDRKKTMMFMKHPDVSFILATGGPSIVQAAYSSGTPAIGVGSGNAPVLVCSDADPESVARKVIQGKSFDNGVICGSENNLVVVQSIRAELIKNLETNGAAVLNPDEKNRLAAVIFDPETEGLKRGIVGKSAEHIAGLAGIRRSTSIRLLVAPVDLNEIDSSFGYEKLAPILSFFTVRNEDHGIVICKQILEQQGLGHTAIIHTKNDALARRFGLEISAGRILVNVSGSQGCIGIGTGLTPSFTLGCGTYGGNSTTDNVTYTHLLNVKRLALGSA